jgi:AbrB family looped-hinge helix DNA binding protein
MTTDALDETVDFGETTVTSKGQITLPSAMRQALNLAPGDRVRFARAADGKIVMAARKRRSIVDIAKENAFTIGEKGIDLDKLIDEAITEAMADKMRRSTG